MSLPGSLFVSSRRGVLTYGLGSLYLTTISSGSQAVYVLPSDFASFSSVVGNDVDIAVGIIQQTDVVRDIAVVSDILQPLPDGLVAPGLSNVMVGPLSDAPKLRTNESSTEVIVIEWGKSTNAQSPILYQVEYALTAFLQTTTIYGTEFTTSTFIRLEDQTPYTEVNVTVTPHPLWVKSDDSLTVRSVFFSTPSEPEKVMNVRAYVYQPDLNDQGSITALIAWDPLNEVEAGGRVSNYSVTISGGISKQFYTRGNESYFIVRDFITNGVFNNILSYPLDKDMTYSIQVSAVNDGGVGELSDSVSFSTNSISLPQDILVTTSDSSFLYGNLGKGDVYTAVDPLCVNTISRLVYWYNSSMNSIMVQSLDGDTISVFLYNSPISISTMSYEWQGERLYMAGYNSTTNQYELWRVPVMLTQDIEIVYQLSEGVQSVSNLVIDSFRRGRAFWLQMMNGKVVLEYLQFKRDDDPERMRVEFPNITVSALTLDPSTGELWVSDNLTGKIFRCPSFNNSCIEVLDTGINVRSISLDENKLSFTDGSVIYSVARLNPSIVLNSSTAVFQSSVISLHTLSPGQQPLYYQCGDTPTTCLAPDLIFDLFSDIAPTSVKECCYDKIFSFPLVQYVYGLNQVDPPMSDLEEPFQRRLLIDGLQPFDSYNIFLGFCNQYTIFLNQLPCSFATLWIQRIRTSEGENNMIIGFNSTTYTAFERENNATVCVEIQNLMGALRPFTVSLLPEEGKAISSNEYTLECNRVLEFATNDKQMCYSYNITDDMKCELGEETTQFKLRLSLSSTIGLDIDPMMSEATVTIDDSGEPECYVQVGFEQSRYTISDSNSVVRVCINSTSPGISASYEITVVTEDPTNIPLFESPVNLNFTVNSVNNFQLECFNSTDLGLINNICDWFQRCSNLNFQLLIKRNDSSSFVLEDRNQTNIVVEPPNICGCPTYNVAAVISASVLSAFVVITVIAILIILCCLYIRRKRRSKLLTFDENFELTNEHTSMGLDEKKRSILSTHLKEELKNKRMVYGKDQLHLSNTVGHGESGQVYKAYLDTAIGRELVAVKTGKALFSKTDVKRLGKEISTMLSFKHENVMSLIGVCLDGEIPLLIMPFMSNGSLLEFVKQHKMELFCLKVSQSVSNEVRKNLLNMCYQVSKGMEYLVEKRFVHRDLAARNCMIDPKGVIKVADFGLTEDMYGTNYFRRRKSVTSEEKVPIRWMAPESILNDIYTEATDVWAFGVTMWEVFTCGRTPYSGIPVMNLMKILQRGERLERPENEACSEELYTIMLQCWSLKPKERPHFNVLVTQLSGILEMTAGYLDLSKSLCWKDDPDTTLSPGQASLVPITEEKEKEHTEDEEPKQ